MGDVREVSNYVAALEHGLARLAEEFALSLRLIKEMHSILLARGRGGSRTPGEFRKTQNRIGGTRPGNLSIRRIKIVMKSAASAGPQHPPCKFTGP